jgi:hypothetical protein
MDEMEEKIGTILSNPQLMQQIMSMAQSLNQSADPPPKPQPKQEPAPSMPNIDPAMIKKLSGLAGQSSVDREQQALLTALSPYLSRERIGKLEKAMRAAKMARLASSLLGQGGIPFLSGR